VQDLDALEQTLRAHTGASRIACKRAVRDANGDLELALEILDIRIRNGEVRTTREEKMIVVKIEMWPLGFESKARELGRMYITNDGTGHEKRGNYNVAVCRKGSTDKKSPLRTGRVEDYPRLSYNVWRLILRALRSSFPEEK